MAYTKTNWQDLPNQTTPINATNLNNIENGIKANDDKLLGNAPMGEIIVDSIRSKNMFDKNTMVAGSITGGNTTNRVSSRQALWLEVGTYTFSTNLSSTYIWCIQVQSVGVPPLASAPTFIIDSPWQSGTSYTFTINTAGYLNLLLKKADNSSLSVSDVIGFNYQLETGLTATDYMPYQNLSGKEIYSTGETIVGTWIDGKPIYRKVITYTNSSTIGASNQITDVDISHDISNIGTAISVRGLIGGVYDLPYLDGDGTKITKATWISRFNTTVIRLRILNDTWSSRTSYFILEYTKTTD